MGLLKKTCEFAVFFGTDLFFEGQPKFCFVHILISCVS